MLISINKKLPYNYYLRMIETILQVESGKYPFDQRGGKGKCIRVQQIQYFTGFKDLLQKKSEMLKKRELLQSTYLIKLLKIYQEDLTLHYIYEHIPYSLSRYIQTHYKSDRNQIIDMSTKLFLKKLNYELTLLISQLAALRIELDLTPDTLAITQDEKLKVFMAPRCRMGHKAQIALLALYNSKKQKIISLAEKEFSKLRSSGQTLPNFVIKGNKLLFTGNTLDQSLQFQGVHGMPNQSESSFNTYSSNVFSSGALNRSTASCINPNSNLRQTQSPKFGKNFKFDQNQKKAYSTRSAQKHQTRSHKNSFQHQEEQKRKKSKAKQEDNSDARSFTHSKSVRIQFQQKVGPFQKKQRKESVKVKVTTFHEYQMDDCNPADLFGKGKSEQDIFAFFSRQGKAQEQEASKQQESYEEQLADMNNKFTRKQSMPQYTYTPSTTNRNLEQKVRLAKEKAESLLSRYLGGKKKKAFSMNVDQTK